MTKDEKPQTQPIVYEHMTKPNGGRKLNPCTTFCVNSKFKSVDALSVFFYIPKSYKEVEGWLQEG